MDEGGTTDFGGRCAFSGLLRFLGRTSTRREVSKVMSLERIVQNLSPGSKREDKKDCLECRLVGGLGCIGIGCYIAAQARGTKGINKGGLMVFASGFAIMGALRLSSVDLFSANTSPPTQMETSRAPSKDL